MLIMISMMACQVIRNQVIIVIIYYVYGGDIFYAERKYEKKGISCDLYREISKCTTELGEIMRIILIRKIMLQINTRDIVESWPRLDGIK